MASKVETLVRNFLRSDAESLCLVPGERLYLKRGSSRTVVGREALSYESLRALAEEIAPGDMIEGLAEAGYRLPFRLEPGSEPVEIQFSLSGTAPMMTVARVGPPVHAPTQVPVPSPAEHDEGAIGRPSSETAAHPSFPPAADPGRDHHAPTAGDGSAWAQTTGPGPGKSSTRPIDTLLLRMLEADASDLHLSSGSPPCFRVHGQIQPQTDIRALSPEEIQSLLDPVLPEKNRQEFADRNDTDLAYEIVGTSRFRVNVFRDRHGVGAVFRQIPLKIKSASELNLPPAIVALGDLSKGLVLVTGPTGSGKSTTLAAIVNHINETRSDHIITIEDPIEFVHTNKKCLVNQREVGNHTRGFKDALRAALREDPDIVLVGEMRDLETVAIAIETAETGHLVLGTLHTTTAASTVDRVVDQFPEDRQSQIRVMLADSLRGVVSQTLLQKVGGGRVAAYEILLSNSAVANLVRDGKTFQLYSVMQTSKAQGMILLNDALLELVKRGLVEPREAYMKTVDKMGLLASFKSLNIASVADFRAETSGGQTLQPATSAASSSAR